MNFRRLICIASVLAVAALTPAARAIDVNEWSYAAIAYAPSTGNFRYSYNYNSRYGAEQAALRGMAEKDAKIVAWVNRGFCALALGDDVGSYGAGWEYGDDASNTDAMERALRRCREVTKNARIAICLVSDGQYIYEPKPIPRVTPVETKPSSSLTTSIVPEFNPAFADSPFFPQAKPLTPKFDPFDPFNSLVPETNPLAPRFNPATPQFNPFNPLVPRPNLLPPLINPEPSAVFPGFPNP